ncbi:MAG: porin [Puniceicoccaceae bacterium]
MKTKQPKTILTLIIGTLLGIGFANAVAASDSSMQDNYDKLWGSAKLYDSKDNEFIQKLAFTGRLQYDYAYVNEDDQQSWDDTAWRRARAGFKATVFQKFTAHVELNLDPENTDPVYDGITDAYIGWKTGNDLSIKLGKQSAGFTLDGSTSSKRIITTERGSLSNNFWFTREYFFGATASGENETWSYKVGLFSNDRSDEIENVGEEGFFLLLSAGKDFGSSLNVDKASLRVDFVYNDESDGRLGTNALETILSINGQYDNGPWHLWGDLSFAESFSGDSQWGLQIMPFYDINDTFQVVASYNYLSSSEDNGLRLNRYERRAYGGGRGDRLQDLYIGLNTYFYGHKLKWQNGFTFTDMKDSADDGGEFSGYGFTSAIRLYW